MQEYNLFPIIKSIKPWLGRILIASVIVAGLTAVASLFQKNYYTATTTFYAASPLLATPSPVGYGERSIFAFGNANDLDRLIAIGQSQATIDHLIEKFDLAQHFKIDTSSAENRHKLNQKVRKGYNTIKNKLDALELSFESTDPELSAQMANEARNFIDLQAGQMLKSSNASLLTALTSTNEVQASEAKILSDTILALKQKYEIIRNAAQGDFIVEETVKATGEYEEAKAKARFYSTLPAYRDSTIKYQALAAGLGKKLEILKTKGSSYIEVTQQLHLLENEFGQLAAQTALDKERIKQYDAVDKNPVSALHVVDVAYVPLIKSKPHRSRLVIAAFIITALFLILLAIFVEANKSTKLS